MHITYINIFPCRILVKKSQYIFILQLHISHRRVLGGAILTEKRCRTRGAIWDSSNFAVLQPGGCATCGQIHHVLLYIDLGDIHTHTHTPYEQD